MESKEPPVYIHRSLFTMYVLQSKKDLEEEISKLPGEKPDVRVTSPNKSFYRGYNTYVNLAVPKYYIKK